MDTRVLRPSWRVGFAKRPVKNVALYSVNNNLNAQTRIIGRLCNDSIIRYDRIPLVRDKQLKRQCFFFSLINLLMTQKKYAGIVLNAPSLINTNIE